MLPKQKFFFKNMQQFDSGLAMASLQLICKSSSIQGLCALKIYGQVYRRSGPMLTKEEEVPTCLQTSFLILKCKQNFVLTNMSQKKIPKRITIFDLKYSKIYRIFYIHVKMLIFVTFSVLMNSFKTII